MASDDLFELIKALTPSEKRYFKIHAKTHVIGKYKNSYEKLFDAINYWPDDMPYDEKVFKRKHKGKTFIKNLSVEKNYLHELILETMRSFHDKKTIDRQINDLLLDEDFFRKKRLNEQRQKAIDKAKKLAQLHERMPAMMTLLDREINMRKEWNQNELKKLIDEAYTLESSTIKKIEQLTQLKYYSNLLFTEVRMNSASNSEWLKQKSSEIISNNILKNYVPGTGFITDYHYYRIFAMHHRIHGQMKEHKKYTALQLDLYEKTYPHTKQTYKSGYKIAIYNYMNACFTANELEDLPLQINKARNIPPENRDEEGEDWQNLIHIELLYFCKDGKLKEATQLATTIKNGIARYRDKINTARELTLYYNLAAAFFMTAQWGPALDYYNIIISKKTDARQDIKHTANLLAIICHYQLNNYELVQYQIRNTERKPCTESTSKLLGYIKSLIDGKPGKPKPVINPDNYLQQPEISYWLKAIADKMNILDIYYQNLSTRA